MSLPDQADRKADFGSPSPSNQRPSFSKLIGGMAQRQRLRNRKKKMTRIRSRYGTVLQDVQFAALKKGEYFWKF